MKYKHYCIRRQSVEKAFSQSDFGKGMFDLKFFSLEAWKVGAVIMELREHSLHFSNFFSFSHSLTD